MVTVVRTPLSAAEYKASRTALSANPSRKLADPERPSAIAVRKPAHTTHVWPSQPIPRPVGSTDEQLCRAGMRGIDEDPPVAERLGLARQTNLELIGPLEIPARRAEGSEDLDLERESLSDRDSARLQDTVRTAGERHDRGRGVLDVHRARGF